MCAAGTCPEWSWATAQMAVGGTPCSAKLEWWSERLSLVSILVVIGMIGLQANRTKCLRGLSVLKVFPRTVCRAVPGTVRRFRLSTIVLIGFLLRKLACPVTVVILWVLFTMTCVLGNCCDRRVRSLLLSLRISRLRGVTFLRLRTVVATVLALLLSLTMWCAPVGSRVSTPVVSLWSDGEIVVMCSGLPSYVWKNPRPALLVSVWVWVSR